MRRTDFLKGRPEGPGELADVAWFSPDGRPRDWNADDGSLVCLFGAPSSVRAVTPHARHVLLLFHSGGQGREFVLPRLTQPIRWRLFIDTMQDSPHDIHPDLDGPMAPASNRVWLDHHSMVCFVSDQ